MPRHCLRLLIDAIALGGWLTITGCRTAATAERSSHSPRTVLTSLHGTDVELVDLETGHRWISPWHGRHMIAEVGSFEVSPDGRFLALETRSSDPRDGPKYHLVRILDVRTRRWTSALDLDDHFSQFWFSREGSRLVVERREGYAASLQAYPIGERGDLGKPGPDCRVFGSTFPATRLISKDGRRAYVLPYRRGELVVLDLDTSDQRTIPLPHAWYDSTLHEDPATAELYVAYPSELFRVDVEHAVALPVELPGFTGAFDVASGRFVAACRDGTRPRLLVCDVTSDRRRWIDDAGVFDTLTPTCVAISSKGDRVAVFAAALPLADAPRPRLLEGPLDDALDHDPQLTPFDVDFGFQKRLKWLTRRENLELEFSPDARWIAFAHGGTGSSEDGLPYALDSGLRVLDLETRRVALTLDLESDAVVSCKDLMAGWCAPPDRRSDGE
jgi:hypothetical protein